MNRLREKIWLALAAIAVVGGCSSSKSNEGVVEGTVTLDGTPVETGLIRFEPADGQTATADAQIASGKFVAKVPLGDKRVSITSAKVVGKKSMYETGTGPTVDAVQEQVPARYNVKTELKYTVTAGNQTKAFELQSK